MKNLMLIAMLFAFSANAQTPDRKWAVGIQGGAEQYSGDLGNGFYSFEQAFYGFGGISIARNISEHFDVEINATLGEIGHIENETNRFRFSLAQFNVNAKYNFFKYDAVSFRPFVFLGMGYMNFTDKVGESDRNFENMQLPSFGAGVTYKVTPTISLVLKETFMYTDYDGIEYETGKENDFFVQHSLGVVFNFGKAKDTDGDGISDRNDKCPNTAGPEAFQGCPDTDGDGITDAEDKCPKVAGLKAFQGCPDTDGDGITDAEDSCPEVAGLEAFQGCPDTDGDGITDAEDSCPKVAGLEMFKGCPDTDEDGITDAEDDCPNTKGLKNLKGCPDKDGDGVSDKDDVCPDVAGIKENKGCPEVKKEERKILEKALHGVKFKTGKAIITSSSYSILNSVVSVLELNTAYNLKINGHTDSQGDDAKNMKLSEERAGAVKDYLVKKGIEASRLTSKGFGETVPVGNNKTSKGRAENRRVELTIVF